jgi:predicted MPP superfamily phosphohydrolase
MSVYLRMLIFLVSAASILLGSHYFILYSVLRAFDVSQPRVRLALLLTFSALALSYPLAMLLHRSYANLATRTFHVLSSFWIGLAIHLVFFLALSWVIYGLSRAAGRPLSMFVPLSAAALLALSASLYGLWQAKHPVVTSLEVEINGLPESWEGRTLVQLSDVHLGSVHGRGFLRHVVERVNALESEVVFITGDLFNGSCSEFGRFGDLLDSLEARRGVFFVTGNHEGYAGLEAPLAFLRQTRIRILDDECVEMDGLQVVGVSFPWFSRERASANPFYGDGCYSPEKPTILLYHTPTNVAESYGDRRTQQLRSYFDPDTTFAFAAERGVDLQLSGHTHAGQMFPFGNLTRAFWSGFDRGLHTLGNFSLYVSSGTGTWGPPVRTGSRSEIVSIRLKRRPSGNGD